MPHDHLRQIAISAPTVFPLVADFECFSYPNGMRRLFLFVWLALSLATVSGPALAAPSPDCPMSGKSSGMAGYDHMDCCKAMCASDCAAVCPGVMVPASSATSTPSGKAPPVFHLALSPEPASARLAAAVPPPRTIFS